MGAITPLKTLFIYAKAHAVVHPNSHRDNNPLPPGRTNLDSYSIGQRHGLIRREIKKQTGY